MRSITADTAKLVSSFPIALVVSSFNRSITEELKRGALQRLAYRGIAPQDILLVEVPGAIEIPLIAKRLAQSKQAKAIIALGAVIRGETSHYEYVCEQVSQGCQKVSLDYDVPVIFGVLTTENEAQAWDRLGGKWGHNGMNAADCAITMHTILQQLDALF